jgi:hypothetical protein
MTNKEFCKIDTAFYGDEIDNIKQIGLRSFDGEELKEYVEAAINYTRCCESDSEQLLCKHCDNKKVLHSEATGLCPDRFKHFEAK